MTAVIVHNQPDAPDRRVFAFRDITGAVWTVSDGCFTRTPVHPSCVNVPFERLVLEVGQPAEFRLVRPPGECKAYAMTAVIDEVSADPADLAEWVGASITHLE